MIDKWIHLQNFRDQVVSSGWLKSISNGAHRMSEEEYKEYMRYKNAKQNSED